MLNTLRSRLWFTYAIIIILVLSIVAVGVITSLSNNPIIYRESVQKLKQAISEISEQINSYGQFQPQTAIQLLQEKDTSLSIRFLLVDSKSQLIFDSQNANKPPIQFNSLKRKQIRDTDDPSRVRLIRDNAGKIWLFMHNKIQKEVILIAAVPIPALRFALFFRDEFLGPIIWAGIIAVVFAFLFGLFTARWISMPMQKIARASQLLTNGSFTSIPLEGPEEIRVVAMSFNEMANQLQKVQSSQKQFIADVSHELKTPLTSIKGFAQAILDGTILTLEETQNAAEVIYSESDRMERLVSDLLTLTRLDSGLTKMETNDIDLNELLKGVLFKFKILAEKSSIMLEDQLPVFPYIKGDKDRLIQVFSNLVDNALKFTPASGRITLSGIVGENQVVIQIRDTGQGLTEDDQKYIFDRFYQVDKSRKGSTGKGIGLGLAITKEIINAHSGTITVQSSPGKGTVFTIKLLI